MSKSSMKMAKPNNLQELALRINQRILAKGYFTLDDIREVCREIARATLDAVRVGDSNIRFWFEDKDGKLKELRNPEYERGIKDTVKAQEDKERSWMGEDKK